MPGLPHRSIINYLVAAVLVGGALILTANSVFAQRGPLSLFFAAIVVTTWFGGRNPGIFAIILSVLTADYFILPPKYSFGFDADVIFPLATFTALTLLTVWLLSSRRQIERSLESTVDRYRLLFENNPVPMWVYDLEDLRFLAVNNAATLYYGYTVREFLAMTIKDIRPSEEIPALLQDLGRTDSTLAFGGPWKHRKKDGSIIEVEITSHELTFEGRLSRLVLAIDVTERRRAEALIGESEARYRTLFDYAPDGILIADTESRYMDANSSICKMLGYSRDELIGFEAKDILVASEVEHVNVALSILRNSSDHQREWQFRCKDGSEFPAEVIATMMPDGNLMAVVRDISERRRAEETLRRSKEQVAGIIESAMDAILTVDSEQRVVLFNSAAEKMFRFSADEAMGKPLDRFIPERFRGPHKGHIQDFGRTEVTRRSMASLGAIFGLRSDGEEFPIEASISQLESDGQKYFTVILRDITERKAAEAQNRRLHEMLETRVIERTAELEAANKELEAFSYSVSHDLRAPLRHINGFSQALLEDYADKLDDVGRGYLDDVRNASQEMGRLIDDVLQLARVTRSEMRRERIDLTNMANVILDELRSQDRDRKVKLTVGQGLVTYGDKRLMGVVLLNLLGNAWKFTANKQEAVIEFGVQAGEGDAIYFVRDNGAGFDMAYADKLYGAFQRLHSVSEFEGTGIGLATVQRVIHRHSGRVWAEGELNKGATFYFALPRFKEEDDEGVEG